MDNRRRRSGPPNWAPILIVIPVLLILGAIFHFVFSDSESSSPAATTAAEKNEGLQSTLSLGDITVPEDVLIPPGETLEPAIEPTSASEPINVTLYPCRYFGQKLSASEQIVYHRIAEGLTNHEDSIGGIRLPHKDDLEPIVHAVFYDYPEIFWYAGKYQYRYIEEDGYCDITLQPDYFWDKETSIANKNFVESHTQEIMSELAWASDYGKVKGVYEYLIDHTVYDHAYYGKTLFELFHDGGAVCDGYARSAQYLLNKLGVESIYIHGDAVNSAGVRESHAWNIVNLEGEYYHIDVTWGDPVNEDGTQTKTFRYLCLTDEEIGRNHFPDWSQYPSCTAETYNYYRYEGYYLERYDPDLLLPWIVEADILDVPLSFKAANESVYREVLAKLNDNEEMYNLFTQAIGHSTPFLYWNYDDMYVIQLEW